MVRAPSPSASLAAGALLLLAAGCSSTFSDPFVSIGSCDASPASALAADVRRLEVDDPIGTVGVAPSPDDQVTITAKISVRDSLRATYPSADAARDLAVAVVGDAL